MAFRSSVDHVVVLVQALYRATSRGRGGNCLERSLVVYRFLARSHPDARVVIGARRIDGRLLGHAWVTVGGRAIDEPSVSSDGLVPIVAFDSAGTAYPAVRESCPNS